MSERDFTFFFTIGVDEWRPSLLKEDVPILLPASSFARYPLRDCSLRKVRVPSHITRKAADSGGFVATFLWGDYRYTSEQYVDWLDSWSPNWAATMDYCCEDEITSGRHGVVRERQQRTTGMAYRFWDDYRDRPYAWVPTVQGWNVRDYIQHAHDLKPLITEMQSFYQARAGQDQTLNEFRVGIGTLCKRTSIRGVIAIVMAVASVLPDVRCFHLWGVKTTFWKAPIAFPFEVSSDSASWNMQSYYGQREPEWKQWVEEQARLGNNTESNRTHRYKVLIPRTQAEIDQAMAQPKQRIMF